MDDAASNIKHRIDYDSLREWLEEAERMGELLKVDGLSWEEDIGAFTDILQHDDSAPAVMFDNIPGYPPGYRVLCNTFGGQRKNSILGLPSSLNSTLLSSGGSPRMEFFRFPPKVLHSTR